MTREEAIVELKRDIELDNDFTEDYINAVNMAIQALEQERIRSAEITQYRHDCKKLMEENERLKKALEQQPCTDAISREMALDCDMSIRLNKFVITQYPVGEYDYLSLRRACFHGIELAKHEMENYLIDLPSVTPQHKMGRWIKYGIQRCGEQHYKCTSCGYYINFGQWGELYTKEFKYCPNCGCRMVEPQESEGKK